MYFMSYCCNIPKYYVSKYLLTPTLDNDATPLKRRAKKVKKQQKKHRRYNIAIDIKSRTSLLYNWVSWGDDLFYFKMISVINKGSVADSNSATDQCDWICVFGISFVLYWLSRIGLWWKCMTWYIFIWRMNFVPY